jgi:hypothetical protein
MFFIVSFKNVFGTFSKILCLNFFKSSNFINIIMLRLISIFFQNYDIFLRFKLFFLCFKASLPFKSIGYITQKMFSCSIYSLD